MNGKKRDGFMNKIQGAGFNGIVDFILVDERQTMNVRFGDVSVQVVIYEFKPSCSV